MKANQYLVEFSSFFTQVERPQNGVNSHVLPGSTVAHLVEAKHIPGKSNKKLIISIITKT